MGRKSCFNCTHAKKYPGYPATRWEPEEPPEADCQNEEVDQNFFDEVWDRYEDTLDDPYCFLAEHCGYYDPVMIKNCGNCGVEMNVPEWSHELWACTYDSIPVCSVRCKEMVEEEFREEMFRYVEEKW